MACNLLGNLTDMFKLTKSEKVRTKNGLMGLEGLKLTIGAKAPEGPLY